MESPESSTSRRSSASLAAESVRSGQKSRHSVTPPANPMDGGVIDLSLKGDSRPPRDGVPGGRSPTDSNLSSHRNHPYPPERRRSGSPSQGKYRLAPPHSNSSNSSEPRTEIPPISSLDLRSASWGSTEAPRPSPGQQGQGHGVALPSLHAISSSSSPSTHSYPLLATPASTNTRGDYPRSPPRRGSPGSAYSAALKPSYWDMSKSAPPGRYQYDRREHEMHDRDRERERDMHREREREREVRERERERHRAAGGYPEQGGGQPYWRKPDIPEHAYRGEHDRHRMPPSEVSPPLRSVPLNNKGYAHWHPLDGKGQEGPQYGGHTGHPPSGGAGGGAGGAGYPYPPPGAGRYSPVGRHGDRPVYRPSPAPETDYYGRPIPPRDPNMADPHRGRPRNYSAGPGGAMEVDNYDDDNGPGGGQNRRLAHLLSEQKRRESINTGFQNLRNAIPFSIATDSKAVVLRKATAHIQHLEFLLRRAGVPYVPPPDGWDGMGTPGTLGPDGYRGPIKRERDSDDD